MASVNAANLPTLLPIYNTATVFRGLPLRGWHRGGRSSRPANFAIDCKGRLMAETPSIRRPMNNPHSAPEQNDTVGIMGIRNSSATRVRPVLDSLFESDQSGSTWLLPLLRFRHSNRPHVRHSDRMGGAHGSSCRAQTNGTSTHRRLFRYRRP
jgi:hypothetical protein